MWCVSKYPLYKSIIYNQFCFHPVFLPDRTSRVFWAKEVSMATAALTVSPRRWMGMESWCPGAVRPCRPPSQFTQLLRAASSTAATAEAAAQEEEKDEAAKEEGEESMRISGRNWTIKPGWVTFYTRVYTSVQDKWINSFNDCLIRHIRVGTVQRRPAQLWVMSRAAARSAVLIHRTLWLAVHKARSGRPALWLWRTSWFIRRTRRWNLQQGASGNNTGFLWKVWHRLCLVFDLYLFIFIGEQHKL